jgi:hypothetical protein
LLTIGLVLEGKSVLFDDGVGEHFPSDPLHFSLRVALIQTIQRNLKKLSLSHAFQSFIPHLVQGTLNSLALWIKNTLLQRNVDVSFHRAQLYVSGDSDLCTYCRPLAFDLADLRFQLCQPPIEIGYGALQHFAMAGILSCL